METAPVDSTQQYSAPPQHLILGLPYRPCDSVNCYLLEMQGPTAFNICEADCDTLTSEVCVVPCLKNLKGGDVEGVAFLGQVGTVVAVSGEGSYYWVEHDAGTLFALCSESEKVNIITAEQIIPGFVYQVIPSATLGIEVTSFGSRSEIELAEVETSFDHGRFFGVAPLEVPEALLDRSLAPYLFQDFHTGQVYVMPVDTAFIQCSNASAVFTGPLNQSRV